MKHAKKLASLLLALVMVFALATTAFAANDDGSITISNATVGESYSVYKVFDLTYEGDAVSYTYTRTGETDALYTALAGDASPFTLTVTTTENVYNVSLKDSKTAADVSTFLKANVSKLTKTAGPVKATNNEVKFENLPYGYYYITSSLGTVVTVDSAKKDVTVIDKNQKPGWDPENPTNPDESGEQGKFVAATENGTYGKTSTAAIGDTVFFKVNAYAPKYAGDKLVKTYTFTDTLADGFTYNKDLKVALNGTVLTSGYTVTTNGQTITVVVNAGDIADYPVEAHLSITYSATVDEDAVYDNVNTANMSWTVYPNDPNTGKPDTSKDPYNPNDPQNPSTDPKDPSNPPASTTDTYVFGFNLQKYKESVAVENKLNGAKFKLYDAATEGNEIPLVKNADGTYRVASAEERAADGFTSAEIEAGTAQIFGLDEKTYYLEETVAPNGYNMLTERVPVQITATTVDDQNQTVPNVDSNGILNKTIEVINNAGALLPATGGMGTTLFYVLGGLLVVAAAVLLVTKKRMNRSEQ